MRVTPEHELVCDGGEDVPQPGGPLTDRQKTGIYLFAALVLTCLLSARIGALLNWAWDGYGMGRWVVVSLVTQFNIDIDFIVIFSSGLVSGWLALFVFDKTKKLQRFPALLVSSILAVWIWRSRWHVGIAWGEFWYIVVFGVVVGGITGSRFLTRKSEFPPAAIGLFLTASTLSIIALFDVHLFATEQFSMENSSILPGPTSLTGVTLNIVSTTGFVGLFGWFTLYSDYRSVAVLTTSQGCGVAVIAQFLDYVQQKYNGTSLSGGPTLQRYKRKRLGSLEDDTPPSNRYEIKYLPRHSSRWTRISAAPINIYNFNEEINQRIANYINNSSRISSTLSFGIENILPGRIKRIVESNSGLLSAKMRDADMLMFVTNVTDAGDLPQEGIDLFVDLCEGIKEPKEQVVVITHPVDERIEDAVRNQFGVNNNEFEIVMLGYNDEGDVQDQDMSQLRRAIDN